MSNVEEVYPSIRQEANPAALQTDRFRVRAARSTEELVAAFSMLHEAYVGKGLQNPSAKRLRITPQHVLRESVVFVVWRDDEPIGTATITGDSPAGLPLDKDYREELRALRQQGRRLVEVGSLAIARPWRGSGAHLLLSLVASWAARRIHGGTHAVIGVHPDHANFYRAVFGFVDMAPEKAHAELGAAVCGLVCDLQAMASFYRQHYATAMSSGRSLADEFCGPLPPACVEVPGALLRREPDPVEDTAADIREVFMRRSDHLYTLDAATRRYLAAQRTDDTLVNPTYDALVAARGEGGSTPAEGGSHLR